MGVGIRSGTLVRGVNHRTLLEGQLTRQAVRRTLRTLAARAGYDASTIRGLSGHSMRVGAAQDLAVAGRTFLQIMQAGRWHDVRAVGRYVGNAVVNVWADAS
jgi:hypothetical protein